MIRGFYWTNASLSGIILEWLLMEAIEDDLTLLGRADYFLTRKFFMIEL